MSFSWSGRRIAPNGTRTCQPVRGSTTEGWKLMLVCVFPCVHVCSRFHSRRSVILHAKIDIFYSKLCGWCVCVFVCDVQRHPNFCVTSNEWIVNAIHLYTHNRSFSLSLSVSHSTPDTRKPNISIQLLLLFFIAFFTYFCFGFDIFVGIMRMRKWFFCFVADTQIGCFMHEQNPTLFFARIVIAIVRLFCVTDMGISMCIQF